MNQKKIELVKQLLLKAESTTPEEAEALTAAAEKIMLRLGIDDSMLAAQDSTGDSSKVSFKTITFTGPYRDGMALSMYQVLKAFNTCAAYQIKSEKTITLKIYGRESQVDRIILLLTSLEIQASLAMRAWWKEVRDMYFWMTEHQKRLQRRQFIVSFGAGAAQRVVEERKIQESQVAGSALALINEAEKAEKALHEETKGLKRAKSLKGGSLHAAASGKDAGLKANVGTTQLSN